jgi:hypothetical protein
VKSPDLFVELPRLHVDRNIIDMFASLAGEKAVDAGRLAMRDRVTHDAIQIS